MNQITLEHITKNYNGTLILNNISNTFPAGQSIAFMGHNGCGKSTLLKIIAGLIKPTAGKVRYQNPILFHYVPEKFMPVSLSARTYLKRMGELDGLKKAEILEKIEQMGHDFFLEELLDVPMKHLSKGTLQKIGVIQAFLKTPGVLLLDEPLSGQDEASQRVFIKKVNELRGKGVSILMSCHEQSLVEAISEKIFTIQNGALEEAVIKHEKKYGLIFENVNRAPALPGMEKYGTGYKIIVPEKEAQKTILNLMQNGWELRRMYDEKND